MDIVLGQYLPGNSVLHRLDPRIKFIALFALMIVVFSAWSYASLLMITLFTAVLILMSRVKIKIYMKNTGIILGMTMLSSLLNLFYGSGEPIFSWGFISITEMGIQNSIVVMVRIFNMLILSTCFMFTTSPNDMTYGLQSLLKPLKRWGVNVDDLIIMITIALRFIPISLTEANKIFNSQKSRGADINKGGIINKVKSFIPIILPLFASVFRRAYELSMAMECRCYGFKEERTHLKKLETTAQDTLALVMILFLMIGVIFCNKINPAQLF